MSMQIDIGTPEFPNVGSGFLANERHLGRCAAVAT